jgi:hypothetical protein
MKHHTKKRKYTNHSNKYPYYNMKHHTKKRKYTNNSNKITISIDWDTPDKGFRVLTSKRVVKFLLENILHGNNLIQTQHMTSFKVTGKTKLYLQAVNIKKWKSTPTWNDIECNKYNNWLKASPCNIGNSLKLFVKYKSNENVAGFGVYLIQLLTGELDLKAHKQFVDALQQTLNKRDVYIHNEDVDWFHLKSVPE